MTSSIMPAEPAGPPINEAPEVRLCGALADLLDYPRAGLDEPMATCLDLAGRLAPAATDDLEAFAAFVDACTPGQLEEAYTAFFDLNPICSPYVGHLLFGESYKRSAFLVSLGERYRAHGFEAGDAELADRLSVVMRYVAICPDPEERRMTVSEAILPALDRMIDGPGEGRVEPPFGNDSSPQLEGHSEGEVLAPGFLLGMTEGPASADPDEHPYGRLLRATRLLLDAAWPRDTQNEQNGG